jgi:hypothetical protein
MKRANLITHDPSPTDWEALVRSFPPEWPEDDLRTRISAQNKLARRCVVALDDDPTGTQTVHDIWVLTVYDQASITAALQDGEPALYLLTNTRSMPAGQAQALVRAAAANLIAAARSVRPSPRPGRAASMASAWFRRSPRAGATPPATSIGCAPASV